MGVYGVAVVVPVVAGAANVDRRRNGVPALAVLNAILPASHIVGIIFRIVLVKVWLESAEENILLHIARGLNQPASLVSRVKGSRPDFKVLNFPAGRQVRVIMMIGVQRQAQLL